MPIYTYLCNDEKETGCNHVEEDVFITSISKEAEEKPTCSECESEMSKVISGSYLIHYKGAGFYQTDVNKKNYQ